MDDLFHILIVDDIVDNIQVAMNILREDNYNFSYALSGEEALSLINKDPNKFDLIILDIMMPNVNGFETCKTLKANPKTANIPIIFVTARTDIDAISQAFSMGAVDYLTKPFHAEELLARVKNHLSLSQAKRLLEKHNISLEKKIEFSKRRYLTELEETQQELIMVLTELIEFTSYETGQHIQRVASMSALLAHHHPSLSEEDEQIIFHASPMHDIGKITVPQEILKKAGKLTPREFEIMKSHTTNAHTLLKLSSRKLFKAAAIIAHEHHESWDGSGYPRGLKGEEIHLYGRVVCLADVLDALTHGRSYKEPWSFEQAVYYIKELSGLKFDPTLVDIFIEHETEFEALCNE